MVIVDLILCKNIKFCAHCQNFKKSQKSDFGLIFLHKIDIRIAHVVLIFQGFGVTEVWLVFRSLHTILFLTDSALNA